VAVPEVYGWRRDGEGLFVFMELIEGETLLDRWEDLTEQEKTQISLELGSMVRALRRLKRPAGEEFIGEGIIFHFLSRPCIDEVSIGAIGGQPSMDSICFGAISNAFPNSEAFYDHFMKMPASKRESAYENGLPRLPFDSPIVFTHCGLNPSNILITPRGVNQPVHVLAIIDWEQ
jgi:thiamine kinase-like enzyme